MKHAITKLIFCTLAVCAFSNAAHAVKVAEYGDPVVGNSYNDCTITVVYSGGGGPYLWKRYKIICPYIERIGHDIDILVETTSNSQDPSSCDTKAPAGYTMANQGRYCSNWIVYKITQ